MHIPVIALVLLLPSTAFADCGDQRRTYMAQNDLGAATSLIACLEGELARVRQNADVSGGGSGDACPTFPIIPVSPRTPGNPVGSEKDVYAFLNYYRNVTGIDPVNWMAGAASALSPSDVTAIVAGSSGGQFCSNSMPTYKFDWDAGTYVDADNDLGIILFPEAKAAIGIDQ